MPLLHHPRAGSVVYCDFAGNVAPEIVKARPVVVIDTKRRPGLAMVVPLSTTAPEPPELYHYRLTTNPIPGHSGIAWAKCDLVTTVSLQRLDRIQVRKQGKRIYMEGFLGAGELQEIRNRVAVAARADLAPGTVTMQDPLKESVVVDPLTGVREASGRPSTSAEALAADVISAAGKTSTPQDRPSARLVGSTGAASALDTVERNSIVEQSNHEPGDAPPWD